MDKQPGQNLACADTNVQEELAHACQIALVARFMSPETREYIKSWNTVRKALESYEREKSEGREKMVSAVRC